MRIPFRLKEYTLSSSPWDGVEEGLCYFLLGRPIPFMPEPGREDEEESPPALAGAASREEGKGAEEAGRAEEKGMGGEALSEEGAGDEKEGRIEEEGEEEEEEAEEAGDAEKEGEEEAKEEEDEEGDARLRDGRGGRWSADPIAGSPERDRREFLGACTFTSSMGFCSFFFFCPLLPLAWFTFSSTCGLSSSTNLIISPLAP